MTPCQYEQMRTIFLAARDLAPAERRAYLDAACGADTAMRREIESLLADAAAGQSFLADPAMSARDLSQEIVGGDRTANQGPSGSAASARLGPDMTSDRGFLEGYELLSEIHRGGQGIVYKAMQRSTNRLVAVKVLPEGPLASDRQKHRFEREVRLAASLRHPNIVTIHDSGLTSGLYFYVMEYVQGQPLHEFLATHALSIDQNLQLFAVICTAVAHANQHGVIHRDLKPGNILVDARGEPHVVDFGLAKTAAMAALHDGSPVTVTSQFLGTLAYASPEQTLGAPEMVDARSDVYSLGVILFEMLAGRLPYPITQDMVKSLQTVREAAPARPSSVNRELNSELDTIVLRALAKDPERRYQTVAELGADVEHYLKGEPILARRDSVAYVIHKRSTAMMRRHQITMMAGVAAVVTLVMWWFAGEVFTRWAWPLGVSERLVTIAGAPAHRGARYGDMRLIAITDQTANIIDDLAANEGFTDVSRSVWRSLRRMHGRLMVKLADAGVRGVTWDLDFKDYEPYNDDFINGVRALQESSVNPVIAVSRWDMDQAAHASMAPDIYQSGVGWGCTSLTNPPGLNVRLSLIMHRSESVQMINLALASIAAARQPSMDVSAHLNSADETVQLRYLPLREQARQTAMFATSDQFKLSAMRPITDPSASDLAQGFRAGDVIGEYEVIIADQVTMDRIGRDYHEVFAMSSSELQEDFAEKLVVIADQRPEPTTTDWIVAPDGRRVHASWAILAAIEALNRDAEPVRLPRSVGYLSLLASGAIVGVIIGHYARRGAFSIFWRLGAGIVAFIVTGIVVYRTTSYLLLPVLPITAMFLGFAGLCVLEGLGGREVHGDWKRSAT